MRSIKIFTFLILSSIIMTSCDTFDEECIYQCQITDLQQLGDGEILPLENSLLRQGVSLNNDIFIRGTGFSLSAAFNDADVRARDYFDQNVGMINPRDLVLIRGKSFNYTLFRFDGPLNDRPVVISTRRITKK